MSNRGLTQQQALEYLAELEKLDDTQSGEEENNTESIEDLATHDVNVDGDATDGESDDESFAMSSENESSETDDFEDISEDELDSIGNEETATDGTVWQKSEINMPQAGRQPKRNVMTPAPGPTAYAKKWLRRGSMFVLSFDQFLKLIGRDNDMLEDSLLDLGAGDGAVTAHLAKAYKKVYVTEVSSTMQTLLQHRGFHVLPTDKWQLNKYHTVSCMNLLDRCENPFKILKDIRDSLLPNGRAIVAIVLPLSQYVETGSKNHQPREYLEINGLSFEDQVESAIANVFEPLGFEVESWTRVPYLCEGDLNQSYYWLDDAVFVLKNK